MGEWLPIETAPKDGSQFLVDAPDMECGVSIAYLSRGTICSAFDGKAWGPWSTLPKVWQPLPEPPNA